MNISVITPFYRGNAYMQALFGSVRTAALAAGEAQIELILVNDSPDCPIVYEEAWVEGFSLRLLDNEKNLGIHGSRVHGLREARGEYIWFLDQDDLLLEQAFSSMLALAGDADVILANGFDQYPQGRSPIYPNFARHHAAMQERFYYRVSNQIASPGQTLIRRSAIPQSWQSRIMGRNGSDDLLLWLLLFHEKAVWKLNPQQVYVHVYTGENLSVHGEKMMDSSLEARRILQELGILTPELDRRFLRSTKMVAAVRGKSLGHKLLGALRYPDVALDRLKLRLYRPKQIR